MRSPVCVLQKTVRRLRVHSYRVGVPNSLGLADCCSTIGTEEQKNHYLRDWRAAGDTLCADQPGSGFLMRRHSGYRRGLHGRMLEGQQVLGMRLTGTKRCYITLAPIAACWAAFKLRRMGVGRRRRAGYYLRPDPTSTPGVEIGRRHFPLNVPFQNGPAAVTIFSCLLIISAAPKWPDRAGVCWWNVCR